MDPKSAVQNQNQDPQNPVQPGATSPPNPIEPGQFVVAGENHETPPEPAPITQNSQGAQLNPPPSVVPTPVDPQGLSLAGTPPPPPPQNFPPPPSPQGPVFEQPNPSPYTPPPTTASTPPEGSSKMKNLKMVAIIVGILVLLGVIGGLVYMFILGGKPEAAKTTTTTSTVEEPSAPETSTGPGFSQLSQTPPESTKSATPSASPAL